MQHVIDPKIIDDSSEGDSDDDNYASGGEENGAPIGPMPPVQHAVPAPPPLPKSSIEDLPISNEATLGDRHHSYVSCMSLEPSGNRLVTGSLDGTAKFWDFNAMSRSLQPFQTNSPLDDAFIKTVMFSATGSLLSITGGSSSAVVTDRDGRAIAHTAKGDMYLVDVFRTKGHTSSIFSAQWADGDSNFSNTTLATIAGDSTLRLWDTGRTERSAMSKLPVISQQRVFKMRTERGAKATPTAMTWHSDGKRIVMGCVDGRLRVQDPSSYSPAPSMITEAFASAGTEVTGVVCAPRSCSAPYVLVRSRDDGLHIFDERVFKSPVKSFTGLTNTVSETGVIFIGGTGSFFMTGTSKMVQNDGQKYAGNLHMFDTLSLEQVWIGEANEVRGSVVSMLWHERLNQIMYGTGDGNVHVMYHPTQSHRGILQCLAKTQYRKRHGVASISDSTAVPGDSLHQYRSLFDTISVATGSSAQQRKRPRLGPPNPRDGNGADL